MAYCIYCSKDVCKPCYIKPLSKRKIVVASDIELFRLSHFRRLAIATRALEIPRRKLPDWMADVIFGFEGEVCWANGDIFDVEDDDIDTAFNDDGSFRWLSDFMSFAEVPPRQRPQDRVLGRLRLIDLAFRIAYPLRAKWIAK